MGAGIDSLTRRVLAERVAVIARRKAPRSGGSAEFASDKLILGRCVPALSFWLPPYLISCLCRAFSPHFLYGCFAPALMTTACAFKIPENGLGASGVRLLGV